MKCLYNYFPHAEGHPLAASINRDEQNPTVIPAYSSIKTVFPAVEFTAHLVLDSWLRRCAPVTHQDQDLRAFRFGVPGSVCSPRKPSVPYRVQYTRPVGPAAQVCGFARRRSNPLWLTIRAQRTLRLGRDRRRRAIRSDGCEPTLLRHCHRRPIEQKPRTAIIQINDLRRTPGNRFSSFVSQEST